MNPLAPADAGAVEKSNVRLALVEAFFPDAGLIPDAMLLELNTAARDIAAVGGNPDDVSIRLRALVAKWPNAGTPRSLAKHWADFAPIRSTAAMAQLPPAESLGIRTARYIADPDEARSQMLDDLNGDVDQVEVAMTAWSKTNQQMATSS